MKPDLHKVHLHIDQETYLKVPCLDEAAILFGIVEANREHLRRYMWWVDYNTTLGHSEFFIRDTIQKAILGNALHLCIYHKGQIVGTVGFHYVDYINQRSEIGYWITKEHEGKGLVTRSCKSLIDYAFTSMGLHRIELRCDKENHKSSRIAERLGFKLEGIARESAKLASGFHDMCVYSLLSSEF